MGRKKKEIPQPTSQTAIDWTDIKSTPPPYYKIISVKLKSGKIVDDCALMPDPKKDYFIDNLGRDVIDVSQWRDFEWKFPIYENKKYKKR